MERFRNLLQVVVMGGVGLLLLGGCASQAPTQRGFLSDYSELKPLENENGVEVHRSPVPVTFGRVVIEPVCFLEVKEGEVADDDDVKALCASLTEVLEGEFATYNETVSPGQPTLRVKAAITGTDPSSPSLNLITALALFVPVDTGGVSVEMEAINDQTGNRVAALSGAWNGSPLSPLASLKRYGHAKKGLRILAQRFRKLLLEGDAPQQLSRK